MWSSQWGEPIRGPRLVTVKAPEGQCNTHFLGAPLPGVLFADGTLADGRKGTVAVMDDGTTFFSPDGVTFTRE